MRLIKSDISRDPHSSSNRIIATITLKLRAVAKKNTLNRLSSQLGALTRWKKHVVDTTETAKMTTLGWRTSETLKRDASLKSRRGLPIDKKGSGRDSFSPKLRWDMSSKHESTSCLKEMTVHALSDTILSMSTRTRILRERAFLSKKTTK